MDALLFTMHQAHDCVIRIQGRHRRSGLGDIFQEVTDEIRQARLLRLWARYGRYLIIILVGTVLATAGKVGWDELQTRKMIAESARFSGALQLTESGQHEQAALSFNLLASESVTGYGQLAALQQAAALAESGKADKAIAVYDKLAGSADTDPIIADLASVLGAMRLLDQGLSQEAITKLEQISDGRGPWKHLAKEVQALSIMQTGDMEKGRNLLEILANDPTVPAGIRSRSGKILATNHGNLH